MDTLTTHDAALRDPPPRRDPPRRIIAATLVAALYVLCVLGAPLIVRYGPDPAITPAVLAVGARGPDAQPRCAKAPEFGLSCAAAKAATDALID